MAATEQNDLEHRYYRYLRDQGYATTAALVDVLRAYLPYFAGQQQVLDIGCGHGEFLQLLTEAGHTAVGVDIDPAMVAACQARGFTAYTADVLAWLPEQPARFDAIFSSNVVEHMDAPTVQRLIALAYGALRPGGLLVIGTPNPESLIVQFYEFWRDPTHVRLYSRQLLEFFFADAGFTRIENGNNPAAAWDGIDVMLNPAALPSAPDGAAPVIEAPQDLPPLPPPPAADASLRQRLNFRVLHFVYQKFMEPYVAPLRAALGEERRYSKQLEGAITQLTTQLAQRDARHAAHFQQLGYGLRFPYPAREHFVLGYKPNADTTATTPVATTLPSGEE